jgi:hypothetical protein
MWLMTLLQESENFLSFYHMRTQQEDSHLLTRKWALIEKLGIAAPEIALHSHTFQNCEK